MAESPVATSSWLAEDTMPETKTTQTRKAPKPEKSTDIAPDRIREWKQYVAKLAKKADPYDLDMKDLEKMVAEIEQQIPVPPPVIASVEDTRKHQVHLRKLCHLRTKLTQIQTRMAQAKYVWSHILKAIKGYLWVQPEVIALKNDTARGTVVRKVAGRLEWKYAQVNALIDAADKLIWTLKDNQRAVQAMIEAATEERFLYLQGMEK